MLYLRGTAFLTVLLLLGSVAKAEETPPSEAARFIKDQGLEDYHAMCLEFFTALAQRKPETANEILVNSIPPLGQVPSRDHMQSMCTQVSALLAKFTIDDIELVGYLPISSKAIVLYYVLNSEQGPVLLTMVPFRHQNVWRTHTWQYHGEMAPILDRMRGVIRFSGNLIVPVKREGKRT